MGNNTPKNIRLPGSGIFVYIAIPSTDHWDAQFGMALAGLMFYTAGHSLSKARPGQRVQILNRRGSMLSQSRESILEDAIKAGCTHLLMLDSDMVFPEDALHRLFAHNRTFVGANYVRKCIPSLPVSASLDGRLAFTDPHNSGLEEVLHIGLGCCLLRLDEEIKNLPSPRFPMLWREDIQSYSGEDVYFAGLLKEAGVPIYIDQDLSQEVKHIGSFAYDHSVVGEVVWDETDEVIHKFGG